MDFENLNKEQIEAVEATEGHVRIIAGAGSGKTRVLAYRYAYLVNEFGINPANILCLTFTNKAAQEMRSRIARMVPEGSANDFICTIHSFCVKFLREEIHRIGYPKTFLILDEEDLNSLAKEVLAENDVDRSVMTAEELRKKLSSFKMGGEYVPDYLLTTSSEVKADQDSLSDKVLCYLLLMKQHKYFGLDFQDLIYFTRYIFYTYPESLEQWQRRFNYIMVDEVQDCSEVEWSIFKPLSDKYHNLFIVGDPDQCIYEWRGAALIHFLSFKTDRDIILNRNYRSTSTILDAANAIIENNRMRVKKDLYTKNNQGTVITHFHGKTDQEESDWSSRQIQNLVNQGSSFGDFAVLIRASYLSRSIEQSFMRNSIPYVIWGGVRFFERREIKDSLSYLRLAAFDDDMSFKRIVNVPSRKIGKVTLEKVRKIADDRNCSLFSALKVFNESLPEKKQTIMEFVDLIEQTRASKDLFTVSDLLVYLLKESGLWNLYRDDIEEGRLDNLNELVNSVKVYEGEHKEDEVTLETYLQDVALYTNADYKKAADCVKVMTIHQAKGLEFPYVFVSGLSEGIFPNRRSVRERKERGMEEERRLMYVAVTRAEKLLFLTESEGYSVQGGFSKYPSRFLKEITSSLYVTEGEMDASLWTNAEEFKNKLDREMDPTSVATAGLEPGTKVVHAKLGEGVVESVSDDGQYVEVDFFQFGLRSISVDKLSVPVEDDTENIPNDLPDDRLYIDSGGDIAGDDVFLIEDYGLTDD